MTVNNFEDLKIWQEARQLTKRIYVITSNSCMKHDYALVDQMRRAAVSVMANIAEGFERCNNKEFIQYLYIAKGSCGELRSHLFVAEDAGYIDGKLSAETRSFAGGLSSMINNLILYLKQSKIKGAKHKTIPPTVQTRETSLNLLNEKSKV
ncbi:four helix bundle protein [candidate division TA06 bacterium]|uniref:Four helix bundle protein n=1 Tax=candidate division TA06 bacterium TaxID=2250710 RepID=A0A933I7U0_UNCT6|nr:four helix bundle protein [candidate division TA06 bacterium]